MMRYAVGALFLLALSILIAADDQHDFIKMPSEAHRFFGGTTAESNAGADDNVEGTKWAVLVAGSTGYSNYRHQADVCHAYQVLKKGGLKDENIIVFMYDDIAYNTANPRPGVIINNPNAQDVYKGVPKDYVGNQVTANNFYAVLLGNKAALTGGSGKVVASGPNDYIFVYYSDHGAPGLLAMPTGPSIYANDLNTVLKRKHASGTYKSLVLYIEACESGSMFEGLLPTDLNIYATTAANAVESSYATYWAPPPPGYNTYLGDLYSVSWIEDSEAANIQTKTLEQQYQAVKKRTTASHVMQYGDLKLSSNNLFTYMGGNSANDNNTFVDAIYPSPKAEALVDQRDADLFYLWQKFQKAPERSATKSEAQQQLLEALAERKRIDSSIKRIGEHLFGIEKGHDVILSIRPAGQPLVDDWDCFKTLVGTLETYCGKLSPYALKYTRAVANICNAGVTIEKMARASAHACAGTNSNTSSSLHEGFNA